MLTFGEFFLAFAKEISIPHESSSTMKKRILMLCLAVLWSAGALLAVPFTLHNSTPFKIPLSGSGMKLPSLAAMSTRKVDLPVGEKVFFSVEKKKYLLFEVTDALKDKKLNVADLIALRKKELGI